MLTNVDIPNRQRLTKANIIQHFQGEFFGSLGNVKIIVFELKTSFPSPYRLLKTLQGHPDRDISKFSTSLEFYTQGNEKLSPFKLNPFERIPGIGLDEHIENLSCCLMATMPVAGPLPALIFEALEKLYEDFPDTDRSPTNGEG